MGHGVAPKFEGIGEQSHFQIHEGISNLSSFSIKYSPLEHIKPSIIKFPKDPCRFAIKFDPKHLKIRILR